MEQNQLCVQANTLGIRRPSVLLKEARSAGFTAVEACIATIQDRSIDVAGLDMVGSVPNDFMFVEDESDERWSDLEDDIARAASVGAKLITAVCAVDLASAERTRIRLRKLAGLCGEFGIAISLELAGPQGRDPRSIGEAHLQNLDWERWIVDEGLVRLTLDTFQLARARIATVIYPAAIEHIGIVHISDLAGDPLTSVEEDRCLPGLGKLALRELIASLESVGYAGYYSLELRPSPSAARISAPMAFASLRALVEARPAQG